MALKTWYKLNRDFKDYSINGNNITAYNTPTFNIVEGKECVYLDNVKYLANNNIKIDFSKDFTVSFWIYSSTFNTLSSKVIDNRSNSGGTTNWWQIEIQRGYIRLEFYTNYLKSNSVSIANDINSLGLINDKWNFVSLSVKYVNGTLKYSIRVNEQSATYTSTQSGFNLAENPGLYISRNHPSYNTDYYMCDVRIHNEYLDEQATNNIYIDNINNGLIAHYNFNNGNLESCVWNKNPLVAYGTSVPTYPQFVSHSGVNFDYNCWLVSTDTLLKDVNSFSASFWFSRTAGASNTETVNGEDLINVGANDLFRCRIKKTTKILQYIINTKTGLKVLDTSLVVKDSTIYHIVIIQKISNVTIYCNNEIICNQNCDNILNNGITNYLAIGNYAQNDSVQRFSGMIDEVKIFDRIISESEVIELYNEYLIYSYPQNKRKIFHCKFNDSLIDEVSSKQLTNYGTLYDYNGVTGTCLSNQNNKRAVFEDKLFSTGISIDSLSMGCWVKVTASSTGCTVINSLGWSNYMRFYSSGTTLLGVTCGENTDLTQYVSINRWYHVFCCFDKSIGKIRIYVNGKMVVEKDKTTSMTYGVTKNQLPKLTFMSVRHDVDEETFCGKIDDFRLYNYSLSDEEVQNIYRSHLPRIPNQELLAWYPLKGDVLDYSGNELHGRTYGMGWGSGKIGKAAIGSTRDACIVTGVKPIHLNKKEGTIAFWLFNDISDSVVNAKILGAYSEDLGDSAYRTVFDIFIRNNLGLHINDTNINISKESILHANVWNHICVSYNDKVCYIFINGINVCKYTTPNQIGLNLTSDCFFKLHNCGAYLSDNKYRYNDLRFYNCCLTPQEIKELYNCRVLSYDFNDPYIECTSNVTNNTTLSGLNGVSLINKGTENGFTKYGISGSSTKTNGYPYIMQVANAISAKESVPLTVSMEIFTNVPEKFYLTGHPSGNYGYYLHLFQINIVNNIGMSGNMRRIKNGNIVIEEDIIHTKNMTNTIFLCACPKDGVVFNPETDFIYVKDIMVSETDHYIPHRLVANNSTSSIVYDNSGYNNNGIIQQSSSPSFVRNDLLPSKLNMYGDSAYKFINGQRIDYPNPFIGQDPLEQEWTVNAWIYIKSSSATINNTYLNRFNYGNRLSVTSNKKSLMYLNDANNDYYIYSDSQLPLNSWIMVSFVFRNIDGLRRIYCNGKLISSTNGPCSYKPLGIRDVDTLFGEIDPLAVILCSNYEVYATALSSDEIINMYTQPFTFGKEYSLYSKEIKEDNSFYIDGIGNNLIPNGLIKNTDYFGGSVELIQDDGCGANGSHTSLKTKSPGTRITLPEIEIYPDCEYYTEIYLKADIVSTDPCYYGLYEYDKYGDLIYACQIGATDKRASDNIRVKKGVYLTKQASPTDTVIYVSDTTQFVTGQQYAHQMMCGLVTFEDAPDYERYTAYKYYSSVDPVNKTITLTSPFGITVPAGTKIGYTQDGNNHRYFVSNKIPTTWTKYTSTYAYTRYSTRYVRPFLWLAHSGTLNAKYYIDRIVFVNKTKPQVPPIQFEINMNDNSILSCSEITEGVSCGRNSIILNNVSLPSGDSYLSSMYKHPRGKKFFSVLNTNTDGTKDIRIPVWCDYINGELYMRVFRHDCHSGTLLFDTSEQAKLNEIDDIFGHRYSILNLLDNFVTEEGKYHFLLRYPHEDNGYMKHENSDLKYNEWIQSNNPVKNNQPGQTDFIHIDINKMSSDNSKVFLGLSLSEQQNKTLLDGNGLEKNWGIAVGAVSNYTDLSGVCGIPSDMQIINNKTRECISNDVELWVKVNPNIQKLLDVSMYKNGEIRVKEVREHKTSNLCIDEYSSILE